MTHILIDTQNLFYRARHIVRGGTDEKIGLGYTIILNSILKVWRKFEGSHVVFCLDARSWRRNVYEAYKATRRVKNELRTNSEKEEDAAFQEGMNALTTFLQNKTNTTVLWHDELEADDLISRWIELHPEQQHVIISGDSDFEQLVSENVRLYNGVKQELWSLDGIVDDNGKPLVDKRTKKILTVDPEWCLFLKIMRGDSSDNIMSAYPGVREKGSVNKTGLQEAFEDRHAKGYHWNNLMQQTWKDHEGKEHKVLNDYLINKELIDLKAQPPEIKSLADKIIGEAVLKKSKPGVGVWLLQFCNLHGLNKIAKTPAPYAEFLSAGYNK